MENDKTAYLSASESQYKRFEAFLQNRVDLTGSRAICLMLQRPNQNFHSMTLAQRTLYPNYTLRPGEIVDLADIIEAPIELCDMQTLRQLRKEMNKVVQRIAVGREMNNPLVTEDEKELAELKRYYKQYLDNRLQIRHFPTSSHKAYDLIRSAIKRTLAIAKRDCPEAYHIIKQNLKTGMYFCWAVEEDSTSHKPDEAGPG